MRIFRVGSAHLRAPPRDTSLTAPRPSTAALVRVLAAALGLAACCAAPSARAASLTWGATGTGGTGTWDTTTGGWWNGTTTGTWVNANIDTAVFAGTAGTVTLNTGITAGGLQFSTTGYTITGNTLTLAGSTPTITADANVSATIASTLTGTAGFTMAGSGTVSVTGPGTFSSGTITVSGGRLIFNQSGLAFDNTGGWGNGLPVVVQSGATLQLASDFNAGYSRSLTITGGTLNITAGTATDGNNYINNLTLNSGAMVSGNALRMGYHSNATVTVGGASASTISSGIVLVKNSTYTATFNVADATSSTAPDLTISGAISDYSGLGGTPVIKSGAGTLMLSASNSWSGGTTLSQGTIVLGNANALGSTSGPLAVNTGTLDLNGNSITVGLLTGSSGGTITSGTAGTITLTANSASSGTYGGAITNGSGTVALTKLGSGVLTLSAASTYTGTTTISAGTLTAGNASAFGTGTVSVGASGVLGVNGAYTVANAVSLTAGSTIDSSAAGTSAAVVLSGVISGSGGWTLKANGDTSDSGGSVGGSMKLGNAGNTFTGPITITAGVVDTNSGFGGSATTIILNGGGLVDKGVNTNLANNIQVGASGGYLRDYGSATTTYSGTFSNVPGVGFATLRQTDGGYQKLAGSGASFIGSYYNASGTLEITATNAAFKRTDFTVSANAFTLSGGGTATIKSLTKAAEKDVILNNGTVLDVASGNIAWAQAGNSWIKTSAGSAPAITSSSGTLTIADGSAFGNQTTTDHQEQVVIKDFNGSTPLTLVKNNQNRLSLTAANSYTGGTIINGGRVNFNSASALPNTGNITINRDGALDASGAQANVSAWLTSGRIVTSSSGALIITANTSDAIDFTTGGGYNNLWLASSGSFTHSGGITPGTNGYLFGAANTNTLTVSSNLTAATGLTKKGPGGLTLTGTNTYTGTTTIREGTLTLDFSAAGAPASNILLSTGTLVLAGGTLQMTGKASATSSQTFGGTTLSSARASAISSTIGTSGTNNLTLGAITRGAGSMVNVTLPATGAVTITGGATALVTDATTGGAYATVGTTDWAATDASSNIVKATYTDFGTAGTVTLTGNANLTQATAGTYTLGASSTPGSIRNTTVAGNTLALGGFDLSTAGILSSQDLTINGNGNVKPSASGGELVFVQTANTLTLSSTINTTGNVTKSGAGTLQLSTSNTIGGTVYIAQGTVNTSTDYALGNANIVMGPNTTLRENNGTNLGGTGTITLSDGAMIRQEAGGTAGTLSRNIVLNSTNAYASIGGFLYGNNSVTTSVISGTGDVLLGDWDTSNGGTFRTGWKTNSYVGQTYVTPRGNTALGIVFDFAGTPTNNGKVTPFGANTNPSAILYNGVFGFTGQGSTTNNYLIDNAITLDATGNYGAGNIAVTFNDGIAHFNQPLTVKQAGSNTATLTLKWNNKHVYIDGALGGYGTLKLNSSNNTGGRFIITGTNNSFNGVLSVEKSTGTPYLELDANGAAQYAVVALGDAAARLYVNSGTATIAGLSGVASSDVASNDATSRILTINVPSNETYTHLGTIGANGTALSLVKGGAGTQVLSGSNSYTGTTTFAGGILALGTSTALAGGGSLTFAGGTLQFTGSNTVDYAARIKSSTGGAISIDTNGQAVTFAGVIDSSNTAGLAKVGSGTLTLAGANTYTGTTTPAAGVLSLSDANALGGGGSITFAGGTLQFTGSNTVDYAARIKSSTDPSPVFVPVLMRGLGNSPRGVSEGGA